FEGSQDYDLVLRASERARHIGHIPRILYSWRAAPNSVAVSTDTKHYSLAAGLRAVRDAFVRRGFDGEVYHSDWAERAKVGIYSPKIPDDGPKVAILIPTKNQLDMLARCLNSLRSTSYRNYEVVIIDNESDDPGTLRFLSKCNHRVLRIENQKSRFS